MSCGCVPGVGRDGGGAETGDEGSGGDGLHPIAGRLCQRRVKVERFSPVEY